LAKDLPQLLLCDDDSIVHLSLKQALKAEFNCKSAYNGDEALAIIRKNHIDVLLLDVKMRSADEGLTLIPKIKEVDPAITIVMSSSMTDFNTVREAMRLGAADYVAKSANTDEVIHALRRVFEKKQILKRNEQQNFAIARDQRSLAMVGASRLMVELRKSIDKAKAADLNVLITGETGTGKELVARLLRGTLPDGAPVPFVAVDSSTIQSTTAESQLFGHEKGAFTGADKTTKGIFEEADGGIVYFDEIGNMPLDIQAKLLRALQEKEISKVGSAKTTQVDFRVISATNKDLETLTEEKLFRPDLLQRLNVIPLHIPALRDRIEDIPALVAHFSRLHARNGTELQFTDEAIAVMASYSWPGNVRELSNVVAYLSAMADDSSIDVSDLPPKIRTAGETKWKRSAERSPNGEQQSFYEKVSALEKEVLLKAHAEAAGNISKMALNLGMDRSHLYTKLREHGLPHGRKAKE
jgi:DNA-binding NtrC family response regulator